MVKQVAFAVVVMSSLLLGPVGAAAQGAAGGIAGVVKDTSGAVMPGVTVEASSPALIEKIQNRRDRRRGTVQDCRSCARASTP